MGTLNIVLLGIAGVFLVLYLMRRRVAAALGRLDADAAMITSNAWRHCRSCARRARRLRDRSERSLGARFVKQGQPAVDLGGHRRATRALSGEHAAGVSPRSG